MITYELAKKLKDAGFPQEGRGDTYNEKSYTREMPCACAPTLTELIEACERDGYFDFKLQHDKSGKKWFAHIVENNPTKSLHSATIICEGLTPEEAVVRLWLAMYANTGARPSN
jgi:hypothetical protein